ncbi:MAG: bifunctional folylpolyglutamate synthase/dihydrofolate synthase [Lachnospiraceae bacterium]|nr:bifunctional folylpolyglutamate synthase/dihydrofolate synthase [Lachnospiraceae bacterium]
MSTYTECEEYLCKLNSKGIKPGLQSIRDLLEALGNPEKETKIIHVAGTNGKGSVSKYIFEILRAQGYKVGLYSSPAVFEEREIIAVNGRNISKEDYVNLIDEIRELDSKLTFTRFELETAMAYLYFARKKCDYAVVECGMGGELDATNVTETTEVAVFAAIGMDHMSFLGNSLEEITRTKAGIIKPGCAVAVNGRNSETLDIIKACAKEKENSIFVANPDDICNLKFLKSGTVFDYKNYKKIKIKLLGDFQPDNAITAIEAVEALRKRGAKISERAVYQGLENAILQGRFEIISSKPIVIIDGAHNEPASRVLRKSIERYFIDKKLIYIIGVLKDKEYDKVIENTCDLAWQIITVPSPNKQRTLSSYELAKSVSRVNPNVTSADSVEEAVELALMMADENTAIIAFGSLSYLGLLKQTVLNRKEIKKDRHGI